MISAASTRASDSSAFRPRRDILVALLLKATLLVAIYVLLVRPAERPRADAEATASAVIATGATQVPR